jgi:hypothetical protein
MGLQRLAAPIGAAWTLSLYPEAAEGGGCFRPSRRPTPHYVPAGSAADPSRARAEAGRRARRNVRRYCAATRLNRLATLTYRGSGCHDPREVRADVGAFFRQLRDGLGGKPLPYVWVPEWHKTDHGLHAHFAVGQFVPRRLIERAWGRGFVHIKLIGDLPVGSGPREEARRAAGYLSKYVSRTFDDSRFVAGLHRYDLAQGFQPRGVALSGRSPEDVIAQACEVMGARPVRWWRSSDEEDWQGPPSYWVQWK